MLQLRYPGPGSEAGLYPQPARLTDTFGIVTPLGMTSGSPLGKGKGSLEIWERLCLLGTVFLPPSVGDFLILMSADPTFPPDVPPETLMDTKWVTSELAWTSHPESGVRRPHLLH